MHRIVQSDALAADASLLQWLPCALPYIGRMKAETWVEAEPELIL
jgi:hypothetical protein